MRTSPLSTATWAAAADLLNIIHKAIDARDKDGIIAIRTKLQGRDIMVMIKGSGPGIQPNILQHIFDPFFTTKTPGKGTGLEFSFIRWLRNLVGKSRQSPKSANELFVKLACR